MKATYPPFLILYTMYISKQSPTQNTRRNTTQIPLQNQNTEKLRKKIYKNQPNFVIFFQICSVFWLWRRIWGVFQGVLSAPKWLQFNFLRVSPRTVTFLENQIWLGIQECSCNCNRQKINSPKQKQLHVIIFITREFWEKKTALKNVLVEWHLLVLTVVQCD